MKVAFFNTRPYDIQYFGENPTPHQFTFIKERLNEVTIQLAKDHHAICISAQDIIDEAILQTLHALNIDFIIVRASGTDNVDMIAAYHHDVTVKSLPGYSPRAIAEHAVALLLALNRKIHIASERVRNGNFSIEGLMGFNLYGKTAGIVGIGRVGKAFAEIMRGFGCKVLAYDTDQKINHVVSNDVVLVSLPELLNKSDIISLHCSLNDSSEAIINTKALRLMKLGAVLINTARGKLVDTEALLDALDKGLLNAYGADVYERESTFFYETHKSLAEVNDRVLRTLIQHPQVLLTAHQAFFTKEAMQQMVRTLINELTYQESLTGGLSDKLMI